MTGQRDPDDGGEELRRARSSGIAGQDKVDQGRTVTAVTSPRRPPAGTGPPRCRAGGCRCRGCCRWGRPVVLLAGLPGRPDPVLRLRRVHRHGADRRRAATAVRRRCDNFREAFGDAAFRNSLWLTLVFALGSAVIGQNALGLVLALLMRGRAARGPRRRQRHRHRRLGAARGGRRLHAGTRSWPTTGTLNAILRAFGLPGQDWLYSDADPRGVLANVWRGTAFSMLVYSAALSEVPEEIEEAADDGRRGRWQRLWHVTLPMIRRSIMTNLMLITLQTLSVFGLIYAMTRGGPGTKSQTLPLYMYQQAFSSPQLGYGTAIALVLLAIGAVFSLVYLRVTRTVERPMTGRAATRPSGGPAPRHARRPAAAPVASLSCWPVGFVVPLLWLVLASFNADAAPAARPAAIRRSTTSSAVLNRDTTYRPMLNGLVLCGGGDRC